MKASNAAYIDWAGTLYPAMESVVSYGPAGRVFVDLQRDVGAVLTFATGEWTHLFGPGRTETRCRILIDVEDGKLVAAQEWTGHKFEDMSRIRFDDLAESVIQVNEAHETLGDWAFELTSQIPMWASSQFQSKGLNEYPLSEKALAQWHLALRAAADWSFKNGLGANSTGLSLKADSMALKFKALANLASTDEAVARIRSIRDSGVWE